MKVPHTNSIKNKLFLIAAGFLLSLIFLWIPFPFSNAPLGIIFAMAVGLSLMIPVVVSFQSSLIFIGLFAGISCASSIIGIGLLFLLSLLLNGNINLVSALCVVVISVIGTHLFLKVKHQAEPHQLQTDALSLPPQEELSARTEAPVEQEETLESVEIFQQQNEDKLVEPDVYFEDIVDPTLDQTVNATDEVPDNDPVEADVYLEDIVESAADIIAGIEEESHNNDPVEEDIYLEDLVEPTTDLITSSEEESHNNDPVEEDIYLEDLVEPTTDLITSSEEESHNNDPIEEDVYLEDLLGVPQSTGFKSDIKTVPLDIPKTTLSLEEDPMTVIPDIEAQQENLTLDLSPETFGTNSMAIPQTEWENDSFEENTLQDDLQFSQVELPYLEELPELDLDTNISQENGIIEKKEITEIFSVQPEEEPQALEEDGMYDIDLSKNSVEEKEMPVMQFDESIHQQPNESLEEKKSAADLLGITDDMREPETEMFNMAFESAKLSKKTTRIIDKDAGQISTIGKLLVNQRDIENIIETNALLQGISGDTTGAKVISTFAGEKIQNILSQIQADANVLNIIASGQDGRIVGGGSPQYSNEVFAALSVNIFGFLTNYLETLSIAQPKSILLMADDANHFYYHKDQQFYSLILAPAVACIQDNSLVTILRTIETDSLDTLYTNAQNYSGVKHVATIDTWGKIHQSNYPYQDIIPTIVNNLAVIASNLNLSKLSLCFISTDSDDIVIAFGQNQNIMVSVEKSSGFQLTAFLDTIVKRING